MKNIFRKLAVIEPSDNLKNRILLRIKAEKEKIRRRQLVFSFALSSFSIFIFTSLLFLLGKELVNSEFWVLLKLTVSDTSAILANISEYLFSLLETAPLLAVSVFLIPVFTFFLSLRFLFTNLNHHKKGIIYG